MLKFLFAWFDGHPLSYWGIAAVPTLALLGWLWLSVSGKWDLKTSRRSETLFAFLLLAVLLAWRWPFLLSADEYNPDESQLIAGAMTLLTDAVPWRSLDGTTSGPLNFYALLPLPLLGIPLDYFTARLIAVILSWIALLACYRLLRCHFGPLPARLSILPGVAFLSAANVGDIVHYSSEYVSVALTALSVSCLSRPRTGSSNTERWDFMGCFLAGMLPWAKLQSTPLAAALVAVAVGTAIRDQSNASRAKLKVSAQRLVWSAIPSGIFLGVTIASGQFDHFRRAYLLQNLAYVGQRETWPMMDLWRLGFPDGQFPFFLFISLLGLTAGLTCFIKNPRATRLFVTGVGLVLASAVCVLTPGRAFLHYVLLALVPLVVSVGSALGSWWGIMKPSERVWLGFVALIVGGVAPFAFRMTRPVPAIFGSFSSHWREPRSMLANLIQAYASPGARLAIWGWLPSLNVQTGLTQGTRDGNTYWAILPSPQQEYFRQRFFDDFVRNEPALFVDAVGDESFLFSNRTLNGHEAFRALADYVQQHYQLVTDAGYARFYARKGLRPENGYFDSSSRTQTEAEPMADREDMPVEKITPADLPRWPMNKHLVQMMHPPAEIVWALEPNTREVLIEYGMPAESYRQARTDGAELIFELQSENVPIRPLLHRSLEPVRKPEDRGPQSARLTLPPFKPGAKLVARTNPGPANNSAWDWIYLGKVRAVRSPGFLPSQFPKFNRVPDAVSGADLSFQFEENGEHFLLLHAPAVLTFNLKGRERRLGFEYGFRQGAFTHGGQTDGAVFKVELRSHGEPRVLFEKQLAPTTREQDRPLQIADVTLPPSDGGELILRIESGPSNAWDWTFITNLKLD
ncbi:MAG: hypothetical protein ABIO94_08510 [Opitutaceae bacterium]